MSSVSKKQYRFAVALLKKKKVSKSPKFKKALEYSLDSKEKKAAGCCVLDKEGRVLLGKRADNGLWSNPGGKVDGAESFENAALRELKEEAGILGKDPKELMAGKYHGYNSRTFLVEQYDGSVTGNGELKSLQWFYPHEIPWQELTQHTHDALAKLIEHKLNKSKPLSWILGQEELKKNIIRSGAAPHDTIYEMTHGEALRLVGTGTFRFLKEAVAGMTDESFREIPIDAYTIYIRKHTSDIYSGRIEDGSKQIHQFTNKSLPSVAAELMSIFEWYSPEDEHILDDISNEHLPNDAVVGGLNELVEDYKRHNIVNIYQEMESIREEIRQGNAVDLQQVEAKIMKLFDKLEANVLQVADNHNQLGIDSGKAIDELEQKLLEMQSKVEEMGKKPVTVEAFSAAPENDKKVHEEFYSYLPRPQVHISPNGHIKISFAPDWSPMDQGNFLRDLRAKVIKKSSK